MPRTAYPAGIELPICGEFDYLNMKGQTERDPDITMMIVAEGVNSVILDVAELHPQEKYKVFTRYSDQGGRQKLPCVIGDVNHASMRIEELKTKRLDCYTDSVFQEIRLKPHNACQWTQATAIKILWFDNYIALNSKYKVAVASQDDFNKHIKVASEEDVNNPNAETEEKVAKIKLASEKDFYYRIRTLRTIADKMRYIHQLGFVHNDLNPGNILVNEEGEVKIIDYLLTPHLSMHENHELLLRNRPWWFSPGFLNSIKWSELGEFYADSYNDFFAFAQLMHWLINHAYIDIVGKQSGGSYALAIDKKNPFTGIAGEIANESVKRKLTDLWKDILEKRLLDWDGVSKRFQEVYESTEFHRKYKCACLDYKTLKAYISGNPEISTLNKVIATYKSDILKDFLDNDNSIVSIERNLFIKPEERVFADIDELPESEDKQRMLVNNLRVIGNGARPADCIFQGRDHKCKYNNLVEDVHNQYLKVNDKLVEVHDKLPNHWGDVLNWKITVVTGKNPVITEVIITKAEITHELKMTDRDGSQVELFDVQIKAINRPDIVKRFNDYDQTPGSISWFTLEPSIGVTLLSIDKLQDGKRVFSYYQLNGETAQDTAGDILEFDNTDKRMKIKIEQDYFSVTERTKSFNLELGIKVKDNYDAEMKYIVKIDNVVIKRFLQKYALTIDIANTANVAAFDKVSYNPERKPLLRLGHFNASTYNPGYLANDEKKQEATRKQNFTESNENYLPSLTALRLNTTADNPTTWANIQMGITRAIYKNVIHNVIIPPFKLIVGENLDNFKYWKNRKRTRIIDLKVNKISEITDQAMAYFKKKIVEAMREKIIAAISDPDQETSISFLDSPQFIHTVIVSTPEEYSQQKKEIVRKNIAEITYRNLFEEIPINQVIDPKIQEEKYGFDNQNHCDPHSMDKTIGSFFESGDLQRTPELFQNSFEQLWKANCFGEGDILFISEPEAILNNYLYKKSEKEYPQRILIYDLGGGTLDCLFLEKLRDRPQYEILKKYSNYYGGDIIDIMFLEWILETDNIIDYIHAIKPADFSNRDNKLLDILFLFKSDLKLNPENVNIDYVTSDYEIREFIGSEQLKKEISWQAFVEAKITGENGYLKLITETVWNHLTFNIPPNDLDAPLTLVLNGRIMNLQLTLDGQKTTLGKEIESFFQRKFESLEIEKLTEKESVVSGLINFSFKMQTNKEMLIADRNITKYPTYELGLVVDDYYGKERFYRNYSKKSVEVSAEIEHIKNVRAYVIPDREGYPITTDLYEQLDVRQGLTDAMSPTKTAAKMQLDLSSFETTDSTLNLVRYHKYYHKLVFMMYIQSFTASVGNNQNPINSQSAQKNSSQSQERGVDTSGYISLNN